MIDLKPIYKMTWDELVAHQKKLGFDMRESNRPYNYVGEPSRARAQVNCAFCNEPVTVYIWSYHGGGKKCQCGALLTPLYAIRKIKK